MLPRGFSLTEERSKVPRTVKNNNNNNKNKSFPMSESDFRNRGYVGRQQISGVIVYSGSVVPGTRCDSVCVEKHYGFRSTSTNQTNQGRFLFPGYTVSSRNLFSSCCRGEVVLFIYLFFFAFAVGRLAAA